MTLSHYAFLEFLLFVTFNHPSWEDTLPIKAISFVNHLLADLPDSEFRTLITKSELIQLVYADILTNRDDPIDYVYFPVDSIISLVAPIEESRGMEVTMIGNEGMLGITLMLGVNVAPFSALVQKSGSAIRIDSHSFLNSLEHSPILKEHLNRYLCVSFSQLVQAAICNRFHIVEERLARLLLMIRDRAHSESFYITQDLLAHMLGVRRVGVTKAALALQHKNLIGYSRGYVVIKDIAGLENEACACYMTDKEIYNRMLNKDNVKLPANP
jgi:CRP-like cAMP-binding protein